MSEAYYIGGFRDDGLNGPNNGWLVGTFINAAPRKTDEVEIKYWEYKAGDSVKDYMKTSSTIECTFILSGSTKCLIGDDEVTLKAGDYIVIHPGTPNNTVAEILEDVTALTIKAPSDPSAKQVLES